MCSTVVNKLRVVDSHFHIWDPAVQHLPWLATASPAIRRRFTLDDLAREYAAYDDVEFLGGVYIEVDQEDWAQEDRLLAQNKDPRLLACMLRTEVGPSMRVPLHARGVRDPLHVDSSPRGRCLDPKFIAGLELLAHHGLPFAVTNRGEEIGDIAQAFSRVPALTMIFDHLGNVKELDWGTKDALSQIAELPNSYIKISGDEPVDPRVAEYVKQVFGPKKVLFASNYPVVLASGSFRAHFDQCRSIFGDDPDFFAGNAIRAYGLTVSV